LEEAKTVQSLGATRLVTGHIFPTDCKKGVPPRGLEYLKTICQSVDIPVYAIGGITPENAHLTIGCGAKGVCMMSYLMKI
jgi:thiamine-phosphate pyrophosphorylase